MTKPFYPVITCKHCGTEARLYFTDDVIAKLQEQEACHECGFWIDQADEDRTGASHLVTPDWEHYRIGAEDGGPFRGFGGHPFRVVWLDPEREATETTNLWHQGQIPERHHHRFEVNGALLSRRRS